MSDDQVQVFTKAFEVYESRTAAYGEVWKQYGALSNLLSAARKIDRLMETWWRETGGRPAIHKDALDDAIDAINYLAFFIRNAEAGNLMGSAPERPEHPTESAPALRSVAPAPVRRLLSHSEQDARNDWTPGSY